ncbi:MAG TPA: hypothetical protein VG890_15760 [Puia sp.]|nr:hypothetical protein [Puia sp.]
MTFDFYHQYKDYSSSDLLKIVKRPEEYQEDAVKAAAKLLSERKVLENDFEITKSYYESVDNLAKQRVNKFNSQKEKITSFFEPILHPTSEVKPEKWLNILLLIIGLQYLWTLCINVIDFIRFIKYVIDCKAHGFDGSTSGTISYWTCFINQFNPFIFFQILTLVYVPVIFYLLFKRNPWGWILLFADNLFGLISAISQSYIFFKYQQYHHGNESSFIALILIRGLFAFFLWQNPISGFFSITKKTKRKTIIISTIITVAFILSIQLFV